ncbi:hypothetical protein A5734_01735 [Mycolicibacterium fortuitum]|nr:hypothetical protein A5734_01735 [Mycolicibacterium fortuitum]
MTHEVESDDGRTAACPRCGGDVTAQAEALMPYYEGLNRAADAARQAERRRQWDLRVRVALVVAGAVLAGLFMTPATRESVSPVVGAVLMVAWLVGFWRVFTGRY